MEGLSGCERDNLPILALAQSQSINQSAQSLFRQSRKSHNPVNPDSNTRASYLSFHPFYPDSDKKITV